MRPSARCTSMRRVNGCAPTRARPSAPRRSDAHAALAKQPVDRVGRAEQQRVLASTPPGIAAQHAQARRIFAGLDGPREHLCQRSTVEEAEVHALPRKRVDRVRGVADQGEPTAHVLPRVPERERKAGPPTVERQLAEHAAARFRHEAIELRRLGGQQRGGSLRRRRPDERHPAVGERQQRDGPVGQESLPGRMRVRLLDMQVCDDRGLPVRPARTSDATQLPRARLPAVRSNDDAAGDPPSVAQRDRRAVGVELERFEPCAQLRDALELRRLEKLPLHAQVLDDVPEVRLAGLGSGKPQGVTGVVRARGVPDDHLRIRAGVLADRGPRASGLQDPLRRPGKRRDSQVQRRRIRRAGRG